MGATGGKQQAWYGRVKHFYCKLPGIGWELISLQLGGKGRKWQLLTRLLIAVKRCQDKEKSGRTDIYFVCAGAFHRCISMRANQISRTQIWSDTVYAKRTSRLNGLKKKIIKMAHGWKHALEAKARRHSWIQIPSLWLKQYHILCLTQTIPTKQNKIHPQWRSQTRITLIRQSTS